MSSARERAVADVGAPRAHVFAGWPMVGVLAITETVSYGVLFYAFAVMVVPMRADLGVSTGVVSGALSVGLAVSGLTAPLVGRWVDRHGARAAMAGGSVLAGTGVLAWSQARSTPQLYAAFVVVGLAGALVLYEPAFAVINTWFRERRPTALLAVTVVAGFASTIFVPLSQALVDRVGWRDALVVLAALAAACAVPHAVVLRRRPADLGLTPDGYDASGRAAVVVEPAAVPGERRRAVHWLTTAAALQVVALTVVAVHLVAYLRHTGLPPAAAAAGAGALGVLSVTGRLALTGAARRLGLARVAAGMLTAQATGVLVLLLAPGMAALVVFVVLFGAGSGVMTIARAALLGQYVQPTRFATASGRQALIVSAGRVGAPVAAGALISAAGYAPAFTAVALCCVAAAAALLLADRSAR